MVTWMCALKKGATILLWSLPWEALGCMVALLVEREPKRPVLGSAGRVNEEGSARVQMTSVGAGLSPRANLEGVSSPWLAHSIQ
jgi:hypothetical protein